MNTHSCRTSRRRNSVFAGFGVRVQVFGMGLQGSSPMLNCIARLLRTRYLAAFLLILILLPAMVLTVQNISTAQLNGVVKDPTGAVVPGATVTISDPSKGF